MRARTQLTLIFGMLVALILAGCGTGSSTGSGYGGSTTNAGSGNAAATNTPASGGSTTTGVATVKLASVTVGGASKMVLTNDKGLTLYYRTDDTATTPACTGGCLTAWPPLLSQGAAPTAPTGVTGTFTVLGDSSRPQAEYNGHPLYTFSGDAAAGNVNGEGIGNIWFVAAPADLKPQAAAAGTPPTATPGAGYGYGGA